MTEEKRLRNIERASAWNRANKERRTEIKRRSFQKNRGRELAARKRWHSEHKAEMAIVNSAWKREHSDLVVEYSARRRAAIRGSVNEKITRAKLDHLFEDQRGRCAYCGRDLSDKHLDHIVPISRGGTHTMGNLVWACPRCNLSKGDKLISEWTVTFGADVIELA